MKISLAKEQITKAKHYFGGEIASFGDEDELTLTENRTQDFEKLAQIKVIEDDGANEVFDLTFVEELISHKHSFSDSQ